MNYLDSSVLLRWLLDEPGQLDPATVTQPMTSALAEVEIFCTFDRLRVRNFLAPEILADLHARAHDLLARILIVHVSSPILARSAQPFPTPLRTLDALHLSTALFWSEQNKVESIQFATHDQELGLAARASGFTVSGL